MAIGVGTILYGFCNGYFGRDSYGDKRIVAMGKYDGDRWVVVSEDGHLFFAEGFSKKQLESWTAEEDDGY